MNATQTVEKCKDCDQEKHLTKCYFCKMPICTKHTHYLPSGEHTIHGYVTKTLLVCKECKPKH